MIPEISIIIPVYNVEQYLHRCLDSVCSQTYTDFECILVNDASPDNSPNICNEYCEKDKRFKVIHKQYNEGLPKARKTGIDNSIGNYIMHADSDDWLESDALEILYKNAINYDVDIVRSNFKLHFQDYSLNAFNENSYNDIHEPLVNFFLSGYNALFASLYKKYLFNNYIVPEFHVGEDGITNVQLLSHISNKKIKYINDITYNYNSRNNYSLSNTKTISLFENPNFIYRLWIEKYLIDIKQSETVFSAFSYSTLSDLIPYLKQCKILKNEINYIYTHYYKKCKHLHLLSVENSNLIYISNISIIIGKFYQLIMRHQIRKLYIIKKLNNVIYRFSISKLY